ncbi:hypothetical protein ACVI1L_007003 [Bradyrhizobium sp. USDA 4516]
MAVEHDAAAGGMAFDPRDDVDDLGCPRMQLNRNARHMRPEEIGRQRRDGARVAVRIWRRHSDQPHRQLDDLAGPIARNRAANSINVVQGALPICGLSG